MDTVSGTFTADGTSHVLELGFVPTDLTVVLADGSLMAGRVNTVTVASIKGTFALTIADYTTNYNGVTLGGLTDTAVYHYVARG